MVALEVVKVGVAGSVAILGATRESAGERIVATSHTEQVVCIILCCVCNLICIVLSLHTQFPEPWISAVFCYTALRLFPNYMCKIICAQCISEALGQL